MKYEIDAPIRVWIAEGAVEAKTGKTASSESFEQGQIDAIACETCRRLTAVQRLTRSPPPSKAEKASRLLVWK
jgi:hypothetical protein